MNLMICLIRRIGKQMNMLLKVVLILILLGVAGYTLICVFMYFYQEKLLFFPDKISKNYQFQFGHNFEEVFIEASDGIKLHGVLFKADSSKGLIFYLHGNGGAVDSWGTIASHYTSLNYDLFILDYRGYGKSEGIINSEDQFHSDIQSAFDLFKEKYSQKMIVILGYSVGTGPASWLAANNENDLLILQAPYYSFIERKSKTFPFLPDFILKYKFETFSLFQ